MKSTLVYGDRAPSLQLAGALRRAVVVYFLALALALPALGAEISVAAQNGNIVLTDARGQTKQLTTSGRDSSPVLAPDGKWIVFVRSVSGKKISTPSDDVDAAELWQIDARGKEPTLLVRSRESEKSENLIGSFANIQFSSDGRLVYFVTEGWTTSGAVHVVDTTNAKGRFVLPGNNLEILHTGEYRDCLLVQQHRYFVGGGSFDWFWLFRPDGTEVGPVGEDTKNFKELYKN